jgi:hypothetical protein
LEREQWRDVFAVRLCLWLSFLLSACTPASRMLELAEVNGSYPKPIGKDNYAYFVHGFYVNRDLAVDDGVIAYDVLWDNRPFKQQIASRVQVNEKFKKRFPALIRHEGKTDCHSNLFTLTRYDEAMKPIVVREGNGMTEAAQSLCTLLSISEAEH